ncbi:MULTISPECIES: ribosome hibernation-promoting factor, HPF/YfiA family [unclassified Agarivorans]|uniref:ribosome hibernation-promoting factor, HPF/YfiA family n=1 Tax=unclassified Agarivorans TaxID=2636026 RepID=UPI0010E33ED5|nr:MULTISPECIES: ribosome-associated translation inhibitor RaiA [unclassified Agarivorans]MDO6687671.1 ribosome-associated translation inhibitor RaiA [Agarivorans sp. 3_MG-2023]MDO6717225.1 ribosome-associated translation inhibitor RaiA [Agarivorans sp. 2_MG-2023]MDO6765785.1 ribosome-associated translation inhibitor RaiA [Agarivorans sp. 1_MG-2023]GDY24392.1 ribosomal subunit interface protein [Agarivorans sp. Toyoura001]
MIIDITSKTISITPTIREHIAARFEKLEKNQIPLISPKVTITTDNKKVKIEAKINLPNGQLFASDAHQDLSVAINNLGQKLERQLHRFQDKPNAHRASRSGKDFLREPVEDELSTEDEQAA